MAFQPLEQAVSENVLLPVQVDDRESFVLQKCRERGVAQIQNIQQIEHGQDHGDFAAGIVGIQGLVKV